MTLYAYLASSTELSWHILIWLLEGELTTSLILPWSLILEIVHVLHIHVQVIVNKLKRREDSLLEIWSSLVRVEFFLFIASLLLLEFILTDLDWGEEICVFIVAAEDTIELFTEGDILFELSDEIIRLGSILEVQSCIQERIRLGGTRIARSRLTLTRSTLNDLDGQNFCPSNLLNLLLDLLLIDIFTNVSQIDKAFIFLWE